MVDSAGNLARSQGTTSAGRISAGRYEVIFNQNVAACTYVATRGDPAMGTEPAGDISVATRSGNENGVFVETSDTAGVDTDTAFHLIVVC